MTPNFYHKNLSLGSWQQLSFPEQMANIGSEVERAIKWKNKNKQERSQLAFFRSLELMDFTIADNNNMNRLGELCRLREVLVDYFFADNQYKSTDILWQKYFRAFTWQANLLAGR
ncbi:MAG: hypothetical protein DRI89_04090 [Bacteroidetes bacterium]|nr:MAG: hypothetical protein DRI89_04090 [Bacteroidota bacterium]